MELTESQEINDVILYKKRWLILALYSLYSMANIMQVLLYSAITDIVVDYYGISFSTAQWTTLVSIVMYVIFCFPGTYAIEKFGVRRAVITGLIGTCIGSWVKVGSVDPSRFWVLLLGQSISAIFQVLVHPLGPKVAAVWFGNDEISLAGGISMIGLMGSAIVAYILPTLLMVRGSVHDIEYGFYSIGLIVAIFPTILLPFILYFFSDAPPTKPSKAQLHVQENLVKKSYKDGLKRVLTNRSYVFVLLIFGISYGLQLPIAIVLNQAFDKYHPAQITHVGYLGVANIVFGVFGICVSGIVLDKLKRFREIMIVILILYSFSLILFLSTLSLNIIFIYCTYSLLGFFTNCLLVTVYQLVLEVTYPEPESIAGAPITIVMQSLSIGFTYLYNYLLGNTTEVVANVVIACILILSLLLLFCLKFDFRRQNIENQKNITFVS